MALFGQRQVIHVKETGQTVQVANNPTARLMYYFKCVLSTIQPEESALTYYGNHANYQSLDTSEKRLLLALCVAFSPDKLIDVGIFHPAENLGDSSNKFFEISHEQTTIAAGEGIVIGGYRVRAMKIMMFDRSWLQTNYLNPMRQLVAELERPAITHTTSTTTTYQPRRCVKKFKFRKILIKK